MVVVILLLMAVLVGWNQYLNHLHRKRVDTIYAAIHLAIVNSQSIIATSIIEMSAEALGENQPKPPTYFYETEARKMH